MLRWLALLLLGLNLGLFLWGWTRDRPVDEPLPPLAESPGEIRLVSERARPGDPSAGFTSKAAATKEQVSPAPGPGTIPASIAVLPRRRVGDPASVYDGSVVRPLPRASLPETITERVDPGLLLDEVDAGPPLVIPPVREDDPGVTHTWSRDRDRP
ncbi:MAG: hypothetical protein WAM94_02645 [Chromatiaceae bacterium]